MSNSMEGSISSEISVVKWNKRLQEESDYMVNRVDL